MGSKTDYIRQFVLAVSATSWQLPSLRGSYGETFVMDSGLDCFHIHSHIHTYLLTSQLFCHAGIGADLSGLNGFISRLVFLPDAFCLLATFCTIELLLVQFFAEFCHINE